MKIKKIISTFLLAVAASSSLLLAQDHNQGIGNRAKNRLERTERVFAINNTTNCNNSGKDLSCHLMMNPSIEEGAQVLGEALRVFGKGIVTTERTVTEGTVVAGSDVVSAITSSNQEDSVSQVITGKRKRDNEDDFDERTAKNMVFINHLKKAFLIIL